jgi:ABC-2 type transport system permease protein
VLTLYFTLSVCLMIFIPVFLASLLRRGFKVPWILFAFGTLTFIASQVVHLPLNDLLTSLHVLPKQGISDASITLLQSSLVLGLTAGLCEETARAVGYIFLKKARRLEDGLMLGLGHGGIESMIFGGVLTAAASSLVPMLHMDLSTLNLNAQQLAVLKPQLQAMAEQPFLAAFSSLIERLLAMGIHVTLSIMVLQAFRTRNFLYYILAILYHMGIDAVSVYASTVLTDRGWIFLMLAGMLLPGVIWLVWLWRRENRRAHVARPARDGNAPRGVELGIFAAALRKEILQQWRTRRFLVVLAVFVFFGLTSPMAAKFTPEVLKTIAGAEQFAGLIPIPTIYDALGQYIKNITQFGFILAILLGMNAVAGEKESGTAAMILSKPMPRWAFILSKYAAQALMYAAAFLAAGLGAYYYTLLLFGPFDALRFGAINLLLLVWLLTFVAAALLGSVIGSSIAAAAGFGLGISVAFLLAGSIPQYGQLTQAGLMSWAALLGSAPEKIPAGALSSSNAGALAGALALIVMCLVWSLALFERQEI